MDIVTKIDTREEAQEFLKAYSVEFPHAKASIEYLLGYFSAETAARVRDLFDLNQRPIDLMLEALQQAEVGGE